MANPPQLAGCCGCSSQAMQISTPSSNLPGPGRRVRPELADGVPTRLEHTGAGSGGIQGFSGARSISGRANGFRGPPPRRVS